MDGRYLLLLLTLAAGCGGTGAAPGDEAPGDEAPEDQADADGTGSDETNGSRPDASEDDDSTSSSNDPVDPNDADSSAVTDGDDADVAMAPTEAPLDDAVPLPDAGSDSDETEPETAPADPVTDPQPPTLGACPDVSELEVTLDGVDSGVVGLDSGLTLTEGLIRLQVTTEETPNTEDDGLGYRGHQLQLTFSGSASEALPLTLDITEIEALYATMPNGALGVNLEVSNSPRLSTQRRADVATGTLVLARWGAAPGEVQCGTGEFHLEWTDDGDQPHQVDVAFRFVGTVAEMPMPGQQ